jgi:hypothetical protein
MCKITKEFSEFHKRSKTADGFYCWCKSCTKKDRQQKYAHYKKYVQAYREANRDELNRKQIEYRKGPGKQADIRYREKNREHIRNKNRVIIDGEINWTPVIYNMWRNAKRRAESKNIPFSITKEDIRKLFEHPFCYYLGTPLIPSLGGFSPETSPTLDRVIPDNGYVLGNIVLCSFRANGIKDRATLEDLKQIISRLEEWHQGFSTNETF